MAPKHAVRLLTMASVTAGASEMLAVVLLARLQLLDESGLSGSAVHVATLVGMAAMGLVGGRLLSRFTPLALGAGVPLLCTATTVGAYVLGPGTADYLVAGVTAFATALDQPNINSTINRLVKPSERSKAFSTLQSSTNVVLIAAPLAAAASLAVVGTERTLLLVACGYLASAVPWWYLPRHKPHASTKRPARSAYALVVGQRGLKGLTICRLLSNLVYTGVPVALPYLLAKITDSHAAYVWLQAASISAIRLGLLGASLTGIVVLGRSPTAVVPLAVASPLVAGFSAVVLALATNPTIVIACCFIGGVGQYGSQLTGMVLGPAVTARNRLAEVILAGNTLVRLASAAYGAVLIALLGRLNSGGPLAIAALCSLPAPVFIADAVKAYLRQMRWRAYAN